MIQPFPGLELSETTLERLRAYEALLKKWNPKINLVARSTIHDAWTRHFIDSAQLFTHAPQTARRWIDLGSGGGFPGLVCAIIASELNPSLRFDLIESDRRKCVFLSEVIRTTNAPAHVHSMRIDDFIAQNSGIADVLSARALAPLPSLYPQAAPLLRPDGIALLQKGQMAKSELTDASHDWHSHVVEVQSQTDPAGCILLVSDLRLKTPGELG